MSKAARSAFLALTGLFCGVTVAQYAHTLFPAEWLAGQDITIALLYAGMSALCITILFELRRKLHRLVGRLPLLAATQERFLKYHSWTYGVFLLYGAVLLGVAPNIAFTLFVFCIFALAQCVLLWGIADAVQREHWLHSPGIVAGLFFVSGFAALIYQVVWQRILFGVFGTNIESVAVIVSVFIFGLGIGALAGGQLQKRFPRHQMHCFVLIEIGIAVFGTCSIPLIEAVSHIAPHDSLAGLIATTYALLALPTMLMGSTLPLLVGYLQQRYTNLGAAVGNLYAFNTFGSALASFLTVMLLFTVMGQQATLFFAAACNLLTAALVWRLYKTTHRLTAALDAISLPAIPLSRPFSYRKALLLSALVGYLSLSLEIVWLRILGFMTANMPQVFGTLLAVYLAGIAWGSLEAKRWSEASRDPYVFITRALLALAALAFFCVPLTGLIASWISQPIGEIAAYAFTGLIAYVSGGIFPLLCELGVRQRDRHTGVGVSWIYFFNIMGATLGSLITGFVLFDALTLGWNVVLLCGGAVLTLLLLVQKRPVRKVAAAMGALGLMLFLYPVLYTGIIDNLQGLPPQLRAKYVHENRHGIITVLANPEGDVVFGNGVYDGRFNLNPVIDSNGITRVYMLATLHPDPQRVLELGMSAGAATKVLTMYPRVKELTTVEINPGYADVIAHYPDIASGLRHPKLNLVIDDGRRWLNRNRDARFDVITMNTLYWWRNQATHLLSREFLELCKSRLNPGGIVYYNTTGARDSVYTAASVFKHVVVVGSFVAASDTPFTLSDAQKRRNLMSFTGDDGKPVFANPAYRAKREGLIATPLPDQRDAVLSEDRLWLITDDNMASEYKVGHSPLPAYWYK